MSLIRMEAMKRLMVLVCILPLFLMFFPGLPASGGTLHAEGERFHKAGAVNCNQCQITQGENGSAMTTGSFLDHKVAA